MRVLITGAGIRVGRAIARDFAAAGHQVVIHYRRSRESAQALLQELGGEAAGHACVMADLDDDAQLEGLVPGLVNRGLVPDCLVNNAGTFPREPLAESSLASLRSTFHTNCLAPFVLMQGMVRQVAEGVIVNILDQRVDSVNPEVGAYGIAKKALRDFTLAAALDWAPAWRVNAVAPGLVLAPADMPAEKRQAQVSRVPLGCESAPEEIARACRFLAEADTITGEILRVDGGLGLTRLRD